MTVFATIREYFTLSDARATAKIVPADARDAIGRRLALGRQRSEAADALWSNGHVAEGLRLAAEAFDATLEAVAPFERAIGSGHPALVPAPEPHRAPSREESEESTNAPDEPGTELDAEAKAESDGEPASSIDETEAKADEAPASDAPAESDDAQATAESDPVAPDAPTELAMSAPLAERPRDASVGEPEWATMLRRRGLSDSKMRAVVETDRAVRAKTFPLLDQDVSASEGELFQQLVTARRHVDQALSPASMTAGQLAWTRASRIGFAAFVACAVIVGLYLLLRAPTGVEATASGQYNAEFVPGNAVDGDDATEWLLPDRQAGWVDVRIMPPEHIDTLRLKNAHNRHYNDRGTHEYSIDVYSNGRKVRTVQGSWNAISPRPDWTDHALDIDDVDRIRVNVRSWHRNGGGLAEIDWN